MPLNEQRSNETREITITAQDSRAGAVTIVDVQ